MSLYPGTSSIRPTLKRFPQSDPSPCHVRSEDVIVLHTSIFPGLGLTLYAASANTYLKITVKIPATCAKSVSLKSHKTRLSLVQLVFKMIFIYLFLQFILSGRSCSGFRSPYTCGCGQPSYAHRTLVSRVKPRSLVYLKKKEKKKAKYIKLKT